MRQHTEMVARIYKYTHVGVTNMYNFLSEFATVRWSMLISFLWLLPIFYILGVVTVIIYDYTHRPNKSEGKNRHE